MLSARIQSAAAIEAPLLFDVEGEQYSLDAMLMANADDTDLCDWLRTAAVGEQFPAFVECRRFA
jgi:hypothetical protein